MVHSCDVVGIRSSAEEAPAAATGSRSSAREEVPVAAGCSRSSAGEAATTGVEGIHGEAATATAAASAGGPGWGWR